MLRATSEMAVAIRVWSVAENPLAAAISRPFWRAATTSTSVEIGTRASGATTRAPSVGSAQHLESFLEIQGGRHALEGQAQLNHREGDVWLDAHDYRVRTAQLGDVGDPADGSTGEGIHDVEGRHVYDNALDSQPSNTVSKLFSELCQVLVSERGLDGRDQDIALLENSLRHGASPRR